jgi:hypothetical protein
MSAPTDTPSSTREMRQLIAGATAALTGRKRGPDKSVRRDSYDIEDPRAQVFRPIGDGTIAGAMGWIDALLQTAREFDRAHKKPGQRGGLGGPYAIIVLEALLGRRGVIAIDFKTGRLDPALATLEKITGFARATIVRHLAKLREHGFLDWVRRSRKTGNDREFAPARADVERLFLQPVAPAQGGPAPLPGPCGGTPGQGRRPRRDRPHGHPGPATAPKTG